VSVPLRKAGIVGYVEGVLAQPVVVIHEWDGRMDGCEVAKRRREQLVLPNVVLVAMTSKSWRPPWRRQPIAHVFVRGRTASPHEISGQSVRHFRSSLSEKQAMT
jgi:hypothetical protein